MHLTLNGTARDFDELNAGATVAMLVESLGFRPDRVALEQNGSIVPRTRWPQTVLNENDRIEVVHFVGGGSA